MKQLFSDVEGVCQSDGKRCVRMFNWISEKRPRKSWFAPPALAAQGNSIRPVSRRSKMFDMFFRVLRQSTRLVVTFIGNDPPRVLDGTPSNRHIFRESQ